MVYLITYECDVKGLASVKRINGIMYVYNNNNARQARQYAESFIKDFYGDAFAIISVEPVVVYNLNFDEG